MLLRLFQRQVEFQCEAVLLSAAEVDRALAAHESRHVWVAVQNLLTAAANLSKALWGVEAKLADQRADLRVSLAVDDASPLRPRTMRNHFEHYDERLEKWWTTSASRNHLDMSIMPSGAVKGLDIADMFRVLDPETGDMIFWGERFNLPEIIAEAARIHPVAVAEGSMPHW